MNTYYIKFFFVFGGTYITEGAKSKKKLIYFV